MCGPFMRIASLCVAVLCLTAATHAKALAQWGTLKGRFVYEGKAPTPEKIDTSKEPMCGKHNVVDESLVVGENGGLANVVLYVSSKDIKVHPDYEKTAKDTVRFDNKHCRFEPHVLAMRVSQTLELHNSDSFSHNSNLAPIRDEPINPLLGPDATIEYKFQNPQKLLVPVSCNIHGWMKGHIVVRDDPYVAVSKEDGSFELVNLPVGELEFTLLHEMPGYLQVGKADSKGKWKIKIKEGDDNDLGEIKVPPKMLVPRSKRSPAA